MFSYSECCHFLAMRNTMVKLWHPLGGVLVFALGEKRYLFKFYHELDIDRVINGAHWTFNNHLLVFHRMEEVEDPLQVPLLCSFFGAQIHDIPQAYSLKALLNNLETLLVSGQDVESSSGGKLNMMDQYFKESPFEDIEGKKRPRVSIKSLNVSTGPDSMVHNDERVSPSHQHISTVVVRRADQKQ
ncbi:hypothetical protein Goshw_004199 [Gossypium schwendimanii]|uniref:DUF4283 domain-containing protein n=1 Tax=Gossypium schwendimanii TaxID=34291 RepID=A0A7J9L7P4_GOSSC|nr:hypothetical protein [Gossypium schwendimanii]